MAISIDVLNTKGEKVGTADLPEEVFGVKASSAVIHEVVNAYLANRRRGTHSTKTRGEVSGGGLKPWKQKHTGRARSGSTRSPLWRHGGITFGPKPRSYVQAVPEAKRKLALKAVLSDALREGRLKVLDAFTVPEPKTRLVASAAKALNVPEKSILVLDEPDATFLRAARNFAGFRLFRAAGINCYDVLKAKEVLVTRPALDLITKRLGGNVAREAVA
jgi:large subunit ribosomal protein L4